MKGICSLIVVTAVLGACATTGPAGRLAVHGVVYGSDGEALPGVEITATATRGRDGATRGSAGRITTARSDVDGRFTVGAIRDGVLEIDATRDGYLPGASRLNVDGSARVLYLRLRSASDVLREAATAARNGHTDRARRLLDEVLAGAGQQESVRYEAAIVLGITGDVERATRLLDSLHDDSDAVEMLRSRILRGEIDPEVRS